MSEYVPTGVGLGAGELEAGSCEMLVRISLAHRIMDVPTRVELGARGRLWPIPQVRMCLIHRRMNIPTWEWEISR
jgi:hypothetical protein